ncbi:carboxymuconolactone decarboxylase family protein [Halomonas sp. CKK8]|uniref:carboxymuconolactone decarboxylase family protein n=1 Tax=Halomonas sp. CKK8 TaxID=3036127 RepID=UPI0024153B5B|nr:carboxymuconolactone decarboxylase family protein [Halomonas sp. CKK8]WFM73084.1 carboxymuconolactone decarboxylase family protein [Halomonas sp. CKK8]
MSRVPLLCADTACEQAAPTLRGIHKQLGMLPNFFAGMAHHGGALNGYLAFEQQLGKESRLNKSQRERLALAIANENGCHYCVSGHTLAAKGAGLSDEEARHAQMGRATAPLDQAVLDLGLAVLRQHGHLEDAQVAAAREAGVDDATLVEVVALVGLNSYSNWLNNVMQPPIDFPEVALVETPDQG